MCDCFHLAFPNWHAASSGAGAGRRLRGPEPGAEDDSICDEPSQFTEAERPRPQGSSPVEEYPEIEKYTDSDKECEAEYDPHHKSGSGKKTKKSGLGSMFEKRSTPKMSKLKEVHSPESGLIVKTAKDGCAEGLIYGGGGKDGIFIKEVVPESPASKTLKLKEGDQILSATVYFDNVSYEDAIQILEHAQAYKVKLCLKRKPDITETEPAVETDVIPEEELDAPEIREQGKTKRRGDARISWPKFPSFGKGRKSRFTRSHSSSEADEQRKLELSPTTSDTESPIKSQDALKGKKRHKMKLSVLTKRGRISSSEDQDTDAPTTGQISGDQYQTASEMLSPERPESLTGETPGVHVTEENLTPEQNDQKLTDLQNVQHKVELISIDSTLKTADLTVALADQESPSGIKSPSEKKKKKERSELKMKILGKDKSHKKDAKAKASPKRLKTLGASFEIADQPENEKSDLIPGSESHTEVQGDQLPLDANTQIISSESSRAKSVTAQMEMSVPKVELVQKSPKKGEEKAKKGKDIKQKQGRKTSPTFKLPKIGLSDIAAEETIQKTNVNVEEYPTKIEQLKSQGTEVSEDPYDRLSKSSLTRTQLPKREEIEIPGMEDMSMKITGKGMKEPKMVLPGHYEEIQAETVQLSIDVDSVKEAVSKLPGFKLPKVDTSGLPIPEEITVIDANAQRISVKTPTKVVDTKSKHDTHFTKFDITASPEISTPTVKLPKITPADQTTEEPLTETKVDFEKPGKEHKTKQKQSDKEMKTEVYKREDIVIPGKESAQEAILQAQETQEGIRLESKSAATFSPKDSDKKSKKIRLTMPSFGIAKPDMRIPNIGIDLPKQNVSEQKRDTIKGERTVLLQEVKTSKTETKTGQTWGAISDVKIPEIDSIEYIDSAGDSPAKKDGGIRVAGFGVTLDAAKPKADISFPETSEVKDVGDEEHLVKLAKSGADTTHMSGNVPDADKDIDGADIKILEREGKSSKFKKLEVTKPELEIKPLQTEAEPDGQGSKFKMPKFGIKMPKIKGPEFDLSLSKKDGAVALSEAKADVKIQGAPEADASLGKVDLSITAQKMEVKKPELEIKPLQTEGELDGQGSKFKMPKLGITMTKVKGPEIDFSLSKKDVDVTLPEDKAEVKLPDVELKDPSAKVEMKTLEIKGAEKDVEGSPSKFKMPAFKLPKFGAVAPNTSFEVSSKTKDIQIPETQLKAPEGVDTAVDITVPNINMEGPSHDVKTTAAETDGKGSKFKMPKFGISLPKVKGPEIDLSLSKKDVDVTLPEAEVDVKLPDAEHTEPGIKVEVKAPEIAVHQQDVEGSPSKFKMPTFKLPKFGGGTPNVSVEVPDMEKDVKIDGADINIPEEGRAVNIAVPSVDVEGPSLDVKTTGSEHEGKGSKFKMPHLSFSMPKAKGPQISIAKKDDVTLPAAKAEVQLPEAPKVDISGGKADVSIPEANLEVKQPELDTKPLQGEAEFDGQGSKFKMPKLGMSMPKVKGPEIHFGLSKKDEDVTLPEAKAEVKIPEVEIKEPFAKVDIKPPEAKASAKGTEGSPSKFKMPTFKLPKFGVGTPNVSVEVPDTDKDVKIDGADLNIPEEESAMNIAAPSIDVEGPSIDLKTGTEQDGKGSKFKMPHLGFSMSKVKGPKIDLSMSKKDVDITLPEAKADVKLPEVDLGEVDVSIPEAPEAEAEVRLPDVEYEAEMDGHGEKFKIPKFGISLPKVKGPEFDLSIPKKDTEKKADVKLPEMDLGKVDVSISEAKTELKKPELEIKPLQSEGELDGQGSKFKMPKFGIKMPKLKGSLPEAKAEIKLPDAPEAEVTLGTVHASIPEQKMEVEKPELEIKPLQTEAELEGQESKFKMPKFGISLPKVQAPETDSSLSKKDVDVKLPEARAELKLPEAPETDVNLGKVDVSIPEGKVEAKKPELEIKPLQSEGELDGQGSKFKMPKFGIKMPKLKGSLPEAKAEIKLPDAPEAEVTLGTVHVSIPEQKMEVEKPELEIKPLQTEAELEGQGSKFKMPKFGISLPKVQAPETDLSLSKKDVDVKLPEARAELKLPEAPETDVNLGKVDVSIPEGKVEAKKPELEIKPLQSQGELDGQGSKFKMPKFGIKMPKLKGSLPEAKAEVKLPDAPEAEVTLGTVHVSIPEQKMEVEKPELEIKPLETEAELEGQGSKFKMPKFGMSMPKVKGPDFHLGFSKKDVDVTLPETKADINLPDTELKEPSTKVEIKAPEMEVAGKDAEGSPSKFKMPNFSFTLPKVKGPGIDLSLSKKDTDITLPDNKDEVKLPEAPKIDVRLGKAEVFIPEAKVEVKKPEVQIKPLQTDVELEGQGSKFKMPKLGITMPKVKGPEIDLSLSKKDADVTLPEAKAEVKLPDAELKDPSAKVEIKAPEAEAQLGHVEGSPSKFKLPTFKLPKFGGASPNVTAEVPEMDKDINVGGARLKIPKDSATVDITAQNIDIEGPSLDVKMAVTEGEVKGSKFKMPKFGISLPKVQAPETDLSLSKKDVDVKLPGAKAELKLPEAPETDVNLGKVDVSISEGKVDAKIPELEIKPLQSEGELDGQGSKFKMPKFGVSMPKVKGPEIDFSLSKKDVDVTLPEAKAEVNLPDVELKEPSAKVEVKGPEVEAQLSSVKGSPSKFKLPTFKLPKFGVASPNVSAELPDTDKEIKIDGAEMQISAPHTDPVPEVKAEVQLPEVEVKEPSEDVVIEQQPGVELDAKLKKPRFSLPRFSFSKPSVKAPEVDVNLQDENVAIPQGKVEIKGGEVNMKQPEHEEDVDGQGSKFKMPKLGITMPKVTGPEIDLGLSKKDVDVTLPEAKAEVKLPDVELKEPSAEVEIKPPEVKVVTKDTEGSPSKFKMPTFKLPKFGVGTPSSTVKVPDMDKDVKIDGADIKIPEEVLTVSMAAPSIDSEGPSIEMKMTGTEHEGKGRKFKLPSLAFSVPQVKGPDIDLSLSKKDVDVALPKADVPLPDAELKEPSTKVEIKAPEIEVQTSNVEGSPSKFKMPTFKLPKFGAASPQVSVEVPDLDKDMEVDGADLTLPEAKAEVKLPDVEIKEPEGSVLGGDAKVRKTSWTLPKFLFSKTSVKGPEADVNLDTPKVDVTLTDSKTEVHPPDIGIKESSSISVEGAPAVDIDAKLKKPRFSLPKFSFSKQSTKELEVDVSLPKADVPLPEGNVEVIPPEVELKPPEGDAEIDGQETKFKMPKFGISMPKVKGPDIDLSLSKKDVEVTPPKAKADFEIPESPKIAVDVKPPEHEAEIYGQDSKFKMPKLGITMPKVKGPEIDLSLSKKDANVTLPEAKAEVKLPDAELKDPSAKVEIKAPEVESQLGHVEGSPSKFKLPTFKLPKFGGASPNVTAEVPEMDKDINVDGAGLKIPKDSAAVDITAQSIDTEGSSLDVKMAGTEGEGKGSKFKMPKFGISLPKVKGPEIDLGLSKKDVDVTLPEAKAEVQPPDVKIKQPSARVEIKAPEIEAQTGNVEGSPSKLKMPTITLPKFGAATPKMTVAAPDVDKDIKIDGTKVEVLKAGATVDVTAPSIDTADVKAKGSELEGSGSKFKMPQFGISMPKVKGPEIDLTLSKKDVDVTLPEAKTEVTLPSAEVKEPEGVISLPDAPTVEVETKLKRPNWTFPKFSFSRTGGKAPDADVNLETPKADVTSPEVKAEVCLPDVEVKGTLGVPSAEEAPAAELDASSKKTKFSLPRFSFSKPSVTVPEVSAELPHVDVSLPEGEVKVQQPEMEIKAPELEAEHDKEGSAQGSKFKLPKFGIALPKAKGPEVDLNASQKDVDITLPDVKAEVKLPEVEVKESSASVETEAKSKDSKGSPLKFKMPTLKMPKFGGATYDVTLEAPDADKTETDGAKLQEDVAFSIKGPSVDIKTDISKATISDSETQKTETDAVGHGSPSKFKLPSFKMPRLSFSRPKPEDEHIPGGNESKGDLQEMEVEQQEGTKSPKLTLTSFGEILKSIDVEFDVPKTDKGEENLETLKEAHETSEPNGKLLEAKEKETTTKQDTTKSPERTGWFKFPKFGLSSPSEPAKISEKDEHKDEKSPVGETGEESPTCSVQSSDAFADVSSTITSEHVGLSLSSPTKVTVKYSDPNEATGLGEIKSNIITSTTRTGLISFEPNVPEKITILSSGVSSSSEDTLRLESGKIHVITTNIQATPEAQHAKLLTAVQVQPAGSLLPTSGANEAASWTVEDSQSGKRTAFERHLARESSSERSESKGTIVITKQITHIFDSSEPISGETASSIQRLRETVHSEKMRFFDGAEK